MRTKTVFGHLKNGGFFFRTGSPIEVNRRFLANKYGDL